MRVASRNIGAFRAADLCYRRSNGNSPIGGDLNIADLYFDRATIRVDIEALTQSLLRSSRTSLYAMEEVVDMAHNLLVQYDAGWQLCRGHDLTEMLGIYLTDRLGRPVSSQEVERDLRMACELQTLYQTRFGKRLQEISNDLGKPLLVA